MITELKPAAARERAALLGAAARALRASGFDERSVCAFHGVPLVSDTHHVSAPAGRVRRGLGTAIALLVAGEEVERGDIALLDEAMLGALEAAGLLERQGSRVRALVSVTPFLGALVAADRLGEHGAGVVRAPDLSAWNVAACLPPGTSRLIDAGCGAGAILLAAARRGARALGYDVDARALAFAEINLLLNEVPEGRVELATADVRDPPAGAPSPGDTCVFNAPLLRAPLAGDTPLYLHAPGAAALPRAFLAGCRGALPGGEALCHLQLDGELWQAAEEAGFAALVALEFARAPDGTPHALLSLRSDPSPPHRARFRTPLGAALPHLRRELTDRLHGAAALAASSPALSDDVILRPAPWLRLVRGEQHDGHAFRPRELRFGDQAIDAEDAALLAICDGRRAGEIASGTAVRQRLRALLERGLLVP